MAFTISDYRDLQLLRQGGMGKVYLATQISLNRTVVIKEMAWSTSDACRRFENEARAMASLSHDNIVRIYDFGPDGASYYIAMEHVDGPDLEELLASPEFTADIGIMIVLQALKGLAFSHDHGIIHRDVKPANVLVSAGGAAKLADFGLAAGQNSGPRITAQDTVVGTLLYIAPETITEGVSRDRRSDIWSAGVLLYRVMSGRFPFTGDTMGKLVNQIMHSEPAPLKKVAPQFPARLCAAVDQCLHKDPRKRTEHLKPLIEAIQEHLFRSGCRDPVEEIARYLTGAKTAGMKRPDDASVQTAPVGRPASGRRRTARMPLILAALIVCAAGGYFALRWSGGHEGTPPARTATSVEAPPETVVTQLPAPTPPHAASDSIASIKTLEASPRPQKRAMVRRPAERAVRPAVPPHADVPAADSQVMVGETAPTPEAGSSEQKQPAPAPKPVPRVAADSGDVRILTFPAALISVDGVDVGRTPMKSALRLPAGRHTIRASAEGFLGKESVIDLRKGEYREIKIRLER